MKKRMLLKKKYWRLILPCQKLIANTNLQKSFSLILPIKKTGSIEMQNCFLQMHLKAQKMFFNMMNVQKERSLEKGPFKQPGIKISLCTVIPKREQTISLWKYPVRTANISIGFLDFHP